MSHKPMIDRAVFDLYPNILNIINRGTACYLDVQEVYFDMYYHIINHGEMYMTMTFKVKGQVHIRLIIAAIKNL